MENVNIALITDEHQKKGLHNLIESILRNSSELSRERFSFFIIVDKDEATYKKELDAFFPSIRYTIIGLDQERYRELTGKILNNMVVHHDHSYTRNVMVFISLFLPDLFPKLTKYLYLDVDMIVQADLCDLYEVNLSHHPIASPLILKAKYHRYAKELNIDPNWKNFNSGIYVLDCDFWRSNNLSARCFEIMKKHKVKKLFRFASQPIINILFQNNVQDVSPAWNVRLKNRSRYFMSIGSFIIRNKAFVLHWAGPSKGWDPKNKFYKLWAKFIPLEKH